MDLTLVRDNGEVLCARCTIADSPRTRLKGLLGRSTLASDEGMLMGTSAIHTCFMRFPIDVVFLDREFVVTKVMESVAPWRIAYDRGARSVVELAAGVVARAGVRAGEQFSLVRYAERMNGDGTPFNGRNGRVRVAIASADSRFLRVTRFLLTRHAFDVHTYEDPSTLLRDPRPRADVVVLDSSTSLTVAARVMRDLAAVSPTTACVVVGEQREPAPAEEDGSQALKILPKWDSFDRLVTEIELASAAGTEEHGVG